MAYEHREGSGSLFPNREKKGDNHPDYKGDGLFNGQRVELAAWRKTGRSGGEFLSVQIKPAREQSHAAPERSVSTAPPQRQPSRVEDDEVPF